MIWGINTCTAEDVFPVREYLLSLTLQEDGTKRNGYIVSPKVSVVQIIRVRSLLGGMIDTARMIRISYRWLVRIIGFRLFNPSLAYRSRDRR